MGAASLPLPRKFIVIIRRASHYVDGKMQKYQRKYAKRHYVKEAVR